MTRGSSLFGWVLVGVVVVLVGGYLLLGLITGDDDSSSGSDSSAGTVTLTAPDVAALDARCMVPTAETLRDTAAYAFDGTVSSIAGEQVSLDVERWYAGDGGDEVEVTGPTADLEALLAAISFTDGGRYLVAATDDGAVMVCGFSAPWTAEGVDLYEEAFG